MTGRQRVQAAIERTALDRIPVYCDELFINTAREWKQQGLPESREAQEDLFDYDCTELFLDTSLRFEEQLLSETDEQFTVADKYGMVTTRNKHIPGIEYHEHPLKELADWPRLRERWNVTADAAARLHEVSYFVPCVAWPSWAEAKAIFDRKRATGRHITLRAYGHWEILWRLRGFTEALMDLTLQPELVEEVFRSYTDFLLDVMALADRQGIVVDSFFLLDDHGANTGLLFSPDTIRRAILPHYRRLSAYLRDSGIYFFLHSCGDVRAMIAEYHQAGVVALNPLQATAMDVVDLKREAYADRLSFIGNIDSRTMHDLDIVLPEIRRKLPIAARGGGYLFSSDHSIPEKVSLATYLTILEEVRGIPVSP